MEFRLHRPIEEMKKQEREIFTEEIEVWPNPNKGIESKSMHMYEEVSCFTEDGQPAMATFIVIYSPDEYVLELRALKYLLSRFRDCKVNSCDIANYMNEMYMKYTKPNFVTTAVKLTNLMNMKEEYCTVSSIKKQQKDEFDTFINDTMDMYKKIVESYFQSV